jgi:hypothetical protein
VLIGLAVLGLAGVLLRGGGRDRPAATKRRAATATPAPPQLPGGGRRLLPDRRIVAFYGAPQAAELGELGIGTPASAARRLAKQARAYRQTERPVLPAMELIAVVAAAHPGAGERYNTRAQPQVIDRYLRAARKAKALLILDIQPGRLQERPGLSMVLNTDGFGGRELKESKYHEFTRSPRPFLHPGFKLFYREDTGLMSPRQVLHLQPPPDVVIYE